MAAYTQKFLDLVSLYANNAWRVRPLEEGSPLVTWDLMVATVAQWIVESGRGSSALAKEHNNFGGLKWLDPNDTRTDPFATRVWMVTPSEPQGEHWRAFAALGDWLNGYWQFIETGTTYEDPMKYADDAEGYIQMLKDGGYATDQSYVTKVVDRFDEAEALLRAAQDTDPGEPLPPPTESVFGLAVVVGHNHSQQGACSPFGIPCEWTWNDAIADMIVERAKAYGAVAQKFHRTPGGGVSTEIRRCYYTLVNPWSRELEEEGVESLCIELHYNGGGGDGTEMLYWRGSTVGEPWARNLADDLAEVSGIATTRRENGIWGIRSGNGSISLGAARDPNCVYEPFFGDNRSNVDTIRSAGGQSMIADSILRAARKTAEAHGLADPLPQPPTEPPVEPPPPTEETPDDRAARYFAETGAGKVEIPVGEDVLTFYRPEGGTQ